MEMRQGDKPNGHPSQEWLTAEEAAKYLKVKTRSLLLWVRMRFPALGGVCGGSVNRIWTRLSSQSPC